MTTSRARRALPLLFVALAALPACRLRDALEEDVEKRVRDRLDGDGAILPPEDPVDPNIETVKINSVVPSRGMLQGGLEVEIIGFGFQPGLVVKFSAAPDPASGYEATDVEVVSENRIKCKTPAYPTPEQVAVMVVQGVDHAILMPGFEYFEEVTASEILPALGPTTGFTTVTVRGTGFVEGTRVQFADAPPVDAEVLNRTTLLAVTPPMPRGANDVAVINTNGAATLPGAFRAYDPLHLDGLAPSAGPVTGGTNLLVRGIGFMPGTELLVGGASLSATIANADETELAAVTLPHAEGAVDVSVRIQLEPDSELDQAMDLDDGLENDSVTSTQRGAFVFFDPSNTAPRIVGVTPRAGLVEGGAEVTIVGVGLADGPLTVEFGGIPAVGCLAQSDNVVVCAAPPGTPGLVDVHVTGTSIDVLAPGAYRYVPLALSAVVPRRGAIAGGTFLRLYGDGFAAGDTEVYFDGARARDITVLSDTELTLRAPPGAEGPADLTVVSYGAERDRPAGYTYFDPAAVAEWTSGGPVEGSVNVTVMDGESGERVRGAFVMLGTNVFGPYKGFTDARGQVTLSGPDLMGPQTVSGVRPGYSAFTWAETNARDLKLMLNSTTPPAASSGQGTPAEPARIRGTIYRLKDEYNYGDDLVVVTTTYIDFSLPLPSPGPRARIINQGAYELVARTGELCVIAMAGRISPVTGAFDVHAMGFHPFVNATSGGRYDNIDITIDTPLSASLRLELVDPPLRNNVEPAMAATAPDTAAALIWYDFGGMGVHQMADVSVKDTDTLLVPMPKRMPGPLAGTPFHAMVGVYVGVDDGNPATPLALYPPQSEVYVEGLTDATQPVLVEPVLGTPTEIEPIGFAARSQPTHYEFVVNKPALPSVNLHAIFDAGSLVPVLRWLVATPPDVVAFDLPWFPAQAGNVNLRASYYYWQLMAMYRPGLRYNNMDLNSAFNYRSRAVQVAGFNLF